MKIKFSDTIEVLCRLAWVSCVFTTCGYIFLEMVDSNSRTIQALSLFMLPIMIFLVYLGHWHDAGKNFPDITDRVNK
jgi:hypothetical protein